MPTLRDIQKRINSVQSTRTITRTMEMVATAKIRRVTERVQAATPYSKAMLETLGDVSRTSNEHPLLLAHDETKSVLAVVIASDRGLAGGFNSNVFRAADRYVRRQQGNGVDVKLVACGRKTIAYLKYRGYPSALEYAGLSADPTFHQAQEIATLAIDAYVNGKIDELVLFYNHARNAADQDLIIEQVLPIDINLITEALGLEEEQESRLYGAYEFEPEADALLAELLPAYVRSRIYYALLDSAAAEQGARRKAMKAATDNATEMIETMDRVYKRARQSAITTEIIEIVSGAAALEE